MADGIDLDELDRLRRAVDDAPYMDWARRQQDYDRALRNAAPKLFEMARDGAKWRAEGWQDLDEIKSQLAAAIARAEKAERERDEAREGLEATLEDEQAAHADTLRLLDLANARIVELEADKARLDFLDQANARLNARFGTIYRWRMVMNHNVNRLMLGELAVDLEDSAANGLPSCRDAIDTEMRRIDEGRRAASLLQKPEGDPT